MAHPIAATLAGVIVIVGAAIVRGGRLLTAQRSYPPALAGKWELPGGRVEAGESDADALQRECAEELDVAVDVGGQVAPDVELSRTKALRIYAAGLHGDHEPVAKEHRALRWLPADDLDKVDWLPADRELLPALREWMQRSGQQGVARA